MLHDFLLLTLQLVAKYNILLRQSDTWYM